MEFTVFDYVFAIVMLICFLLIVIPLCGREKESDRRESAQKAEEN